MNKNNKGFVFVETIVVITFLAASLIIIYAAFTNLLTTEKRRMYYDDPIYLYRSYYILDFLQKNDINSYVASSLSEENSSSSEKLLVEFNCGEYSIINSEDAQNFCESIINNQHFSVTHIYFTYYDTTPINECTNDDGEGLDCVSNKSLEGVSANALRYIRSLGGYGKKGYRMIVEYKETIDNENRYYYSSVYLPEGEKSNPNIVIFDKNVWTNYDKKVVIKVPEEIQVKELYVGPGTSCENVSYIFYDGISEKEYSFDNGSYLICYKDQNGNITQNNFTITKVDKVPPICQVEGERDTWTKESVKLDFKCVEPDGEKERTSGCNPEIQHTNMFENVVEKEVKLDYSVIDVAGNETKCTSSSGNNIFGIYQNGDTDLIFFSPNSGTNSFSHSVKVTVKYPENTKELKYVWSKDNNASASNGQSFKSGETITKNRLDGTYYLCVYRLDKFGLVTNKCSEGFAFSTKPIWTDVATQNFTHSHSNSGGVCYTCTSRCNRKGKWQNWTDKDGNITGGEWYCSLHGIIKIGWGSGSAPSCDYCYNYIMNCNLSTLGSATLQKSTNTGRTLYRVVYNNTSGYLTAGTPVYKTNSGSLANYNNDPETIYKDSSNAVIVKSSGSFSVEAKAVDTKTNVAKSVTFTFRVSVE